MNELKARQYQRTAIAAAVAILAVSGAGAQEAPVLAPQTVVVTGVRAALEQSLRQKRDSDAVVEVVTAEDIGKMPDKNVADAIQRLPGVNTQSSAGGEGGFGENDRVSLRGTSPSLQQTLFNGHAISTGDWFVLNQIGGNVGRSSSFSLLPSELVGSIVVQKSPTADLVEGGVSGAINVITRRPLDFRQQLTVEGSVQANYNDLSGETEPHLSGLVNWKNAANTAGILIQGFSEKSSVRRDGQEILGYTPISATSAAAIANPALAGVVVPTFIGAALFEQEKKREGGAFDIEVRPNRDLTLDFNGFYSKLEAPHQNTNWLAAPANSINSLNLIPINPVVRNNTLVAAGFTRNAGEVDNIYRPDAGGESWYLDLNGKWRVNERFSLSGKLGKTHGVGWDRDDVYYQNNVDGGMVYGLNGLSPAVGQLPRRQHRLARLDRLGRRRRIAVGGQGTVRTARRRAAPATIRPSRRCASARAGPITSALPSIRSKPVPARSASPIRARPGTASCTRATSPMTWAAICRRTTSSTTARRWAPGARYRATACSTTCCAITG